MAARFPIALTIAGSDSSGGAGIQADLKTFSALRVYGASAITALTAQNTRGVQAVHPVPPEFISAQMKAVFEDLDVKAVKIGMTGTADAVAAIADTLAEFSKAPVILDPVMVAESGDALLDTGAEQAIREKLFPIATLVTPNLAEAARFLECDVAASEDEMQEQAAALQGPGATAVLLKGGHSEGAEAVDILYDGVVYTRLAAPRVKTSNNHGTGCTLSSAIASFVARGESLSDAVSRAKNYLTAALAHAGALDIGSGAGPVHHFHENWDADQTSR